MRPPAALAACRAAYGLALLAAPALLLKSAGGVPPTRGDCLVARVLGARQVLQAGLTCGGQRRALQAGALADGLHAATMVILATRGQRLRRPALTEAADAVVLAVAGLRCCPSAGR